MPQKQTRQEIVKTPLRTKVYIHARIPLQSILGGFGGLARGRENTHSPLTLFCNSQTIPFLPTPEDAKEMKNRQKSISLTLSNTVLKHLFPSNPAILNDFQQRKRREKV